MTLPTLLGLILSLNASHGPNLTEYTILNNLIDKSALSCECDFPTVLTRESTQRWRREALVKRGKVNNIVKWRDYTSNIKPCLKVMIEFENAVYGTNLKGPRT